MKKMLLCEIDSRLERIEESINLKKILKITQIKAQKDKNYYNQVLINSM